LVNSEISEIEDCVPALRRYASGLVRNRHDADDLVHDCLLRALTRLHTRRETGSIRAWLFAIMHNLFVSQLRSARVRADAALPPFALGPTDTSASQEDALHWRDLLRGLEILPPEQRSVLLLVSVEDMSYAEAAQILDIPVGTVMSRLSRARERLREFMESGARPALRRVK
jgi:RNA polymerase sigma-70 factor (ECF subfamily)